MPDADRRVDSHAAMLLQPAKEHGERSVHLPPARLGDTRILALQPGKAVASGIINSAVDVVSVNFRHRALGPIRRQPTRNYFGFDCRWISVKRPAQPKHAGVTTPAARPLLSLGLMLNKELTHREAEARGCAL